MSRKFPFHVMVKPAGPACNLNCSYCYYLDKKSLYPQKNSFFMQEDVLEKFTTQYIEAQPGPYVLFGWQGGEPTLRGIDFFKRAVSLQKRYIPDNWHCQNTFQANGVLLTDEWAKFLGENNFLVGLSIDGPPRLHNVYRKDKKGEPTHAKVLHGLHFLQKNHVDYNILCMVHNTNLQHPLKVYNFFKQQKTDHIQFIPLVEHLGEGQVSARSVRPEGYGSFLIQVFNHWALNDLGKVSIQIFDECVRVWSGVQANLCVFSKFCGNALVMEHNGDVYSCDHFVFPEFKLGNIQKNCLLELASLPRQKKFGQAKKKTLPKVCRECRFLFICNGGCVKNRFLPTSTAEKLNYLCAGYKKFFGYIEPFMQEITRKIRESKPPQVIRSHLRSLYNSVWKDVGRNDPCPCGSGKKFKRCCQMKV